MQAFQMEDLRELAKVRDEDNRDSFVTLYADAQDARRDTRIDARARQIRAALVDDEDAIGRFEASLSAARGALSGAPPHARGLVVAASVRHDFTLARWVAGDVPPRVVFDSSPYLRPLARFADENESFALVLLDGRAAAIHVAALGRADLAATSRMDLIGRHRKGGMSQARYQRHRRGRVEAHLGEVAERLDAILQEEGISRVLIAGPGQAKRHLVDHLSARAKAALMGLEEVEVDDPREPGDLFSRLAAVAREQEGADSDEAVLLLRDALKRGELAVGGPFEVARAARDGRADLVLILKDHQSGGAKCEGHAAFFPQGDQCPACGSPGTRVDLLNEAVEGALLTDATVEFVDAKNGFLRSLGGAGALLRW